jgi:hypothetical protein
MYDLNQPNRKMKKKYNRIDIETKLTTISLLAKSKWIDPEELNLF